mmetsp:Transcript_72647/g.132818  ORF Transcript_72647/g.132818 Transcript_72647/m.132818 type:complete len:733 (-) Transcript_72647:41-2239(-)
MQATRMGVFAAALLLPNIFALGLLTTQTGGESPIPRVVNLLRKLLETIETEAKTEEDLYEKYMCWGSSTISSKKASNAEAQTRIDSLTQYVADLDAGAIELTSERTDLDKEIQQISEGLEAAANKRAQENKDYEMAKEEMDAAILALTEAIDVLGKMSENKTTGVFLKVKDRLNEGMGMTFAQRSAQGARIDHAIEIADKYLRKGDAIFLRRALTGEVPDVDWKKLNRKATFKMSYKARSFGIQMVLKKLLETFTANLGEATAKEEKALGDYTSLKGAMDGQLSASQEALTKMDKETGAKGLSKSEAEDEIGTLNAQITADNGFITQTQTDMSTKTTEWKARQAVRADEVEAINKAISILFNDDKRDLFAKSFKSQGFTLLQLKESSSAVALMSRAMQTIAKAGRVAHDDRLEHFAEKVKNETKVVDSSPVDGDHFKAVLGAIDTMIGHLKDEEAEDLTKKEQCEQDRMKDARDAILASRDMDETTDDITRLKSEIQELAEEIKTLEAKMAADKAAMDEATKIRNEENAAWEAANKDDQDAAATVSEALTVLEGFYGSFLQKQAPTSPPTTWVEPYVGKTTEGKGVLSILELIHEDILKDIKTHKDAEVAAEAAYGAALNKFNTEYAADGTKKTGLEGTKGGKETEVETKTTSRGTKFGELQGFYQKIEDGEKACNYFTINYPVRRSNRLIEIDGLTKAKAILGGGRFTPPADPTREIKPGDALLQRVHKHQ